MNQLHDRTAITTRVLLGAIAVVLLLTAVSWLIAGRSAGHGEVKPLDITIPDTGVIPPVSGGDYPAMLDRPLFWPERAPVQPGEQATAGAAGGGGPEGLVYLGVLVRGAQRQVLLSDGGSVHVLREGETIRGLEVRRISGEGVLLGNATSEVNLPVPVDRTEFIEIRRME